MGSIQIVSGTLRGRTILTPAEDTTRPLLSRLRKTLADILRPSLQGTAVLDLFGGSGAIAFELLSNGADKRRDRGAAAIGSRSRAPQCGKPGPAGPGAGALRRCSSHD